MNKAIVNSLTEQEFLLVKETDRDALRPLTEDELVALHDRVRRARNKYVKLYRREASARVAKQGGRGKARPKNRRNADKAEVFEDALARVSAALATAARQSARELRADRLEAARSGKAEAAPVKSVGRSARSAKPGPTAPRRRVGDRALKSPASTKRKASTQATNARRQAKRDAR